MTAHAPSPGLPARSARPGGQRAYNERAVLQVVRLHGALPAAEIARLTQLTAQTVSLITKRLLDEALLLKGEPVRGKVGQPSVPLSLAPNGAHAVGIKIGRRSLDLLWVDFTGAVRERSVIDYRFPDPEVLLPEIGRRLSALRRTLGTAGRGRVQGVGVAAPLSIGGWQQLLGFPAELAARWQQLDLRAAVQQVSPWPVMLTKDTAAACVAELVAGRGRRVPSFVYVFVDTFIGGALVLDGQLHAGAHGNAGALGSLPLGLSRGGRAEPPAQLLAVASLLTLEQAWAAAGLDTTADARGQALHAPWAAHTRRWLDAAGRAIAQAVNAAACLLDIEHVILDGNCSRELLAALQAAVNTALPRYSWEGVTQPVLLPGSIGSDARALGGALLPLYAQFAPDPELFLRAAR